MSYQLQHVVHMRSIDRDTSSYPDPNQYRTVLSHPINIPHGHLCVASVMTAQIPFSFYPVNSKNNTLNVVLQRTDPDDGDPLGDVSASCVINPGNYTATELRDEIQSKLRKTALFSETDDAQANLPKIEVGYESKINKYKFTVTGDVTGTNPELVNVIIKSGTTCGKLLGLPSNQFTVDTDFNDGTRAGSVAFTSPFSINVAGDDTLYLRTNLGTGRSMSYETRTQNSGDLLAKIPIRVSPFSIIHYDYKITNVEYVAECIQFEQDFGNVFQQQLMVQGIDVYFDSYTNHNVILENNSGEQTHMISQSSRSVKSAYCVPAVIPVFKISNLKLKYDWLVSKNPTLGGKSIRMTLVPEGEYSPLERGINLTVRRFDEMDTGRAPALYLEPLGTYPDILYYVFRNYFNSLRVT